MHGTHSGVVTDVEGEEIVVVYETDHGPIEQIYDRTQFREGNVPNVGDDVKAHVFVTSGPMDLATRFENADLEDKEDDFAAFREKGVSGPIEI